MPILIPLCYLITTISLRNAEPYERITYPEPFPATYQEHFTLATEMAKAWDPDAQLISVSGTVNCQQRISSSRGMTFQFGVSKFYFGLRRASFARVEIRREEQTARIVAELFDINGRPATLNPELTKITLDQAIDIAQANGASPYIIDDPDCLIGFHLFLDYIWHLDFIPHTGEDRSIQFEIDSRTGEVTDSMCLNPWLHCLPA